MPDLFFHFASGYVPALIKKAKLFPACFVFGNILPDIVSRIPEIVLVRFLNLPGEYFFGALHSPSLLVIVSYLASFFWTQGNRKIAFFYISFGTQLHFLLDVFQDQFHEGIYMPYFPLNLQTIEIGNLPPTYSLLAFPVLFPLIIFFLWRDSK